VSDSFEGEPFGLNARRAFDAYRRITTRSDRVVVELPDLGSKSPVFAHAVHTFSASYATGGEAISPALPSVPNRQDVLWSPKGGYTFEFVAGDKIKAYTTAATEVAALTNLSGLGTIRGLVLGKRDPEMPLVTAGEAWRLRGVALAVASAVAASSTSYWTIRAQVVRRTGQVEELGSFDTSSVALAQGVPRDAFAAVGTADVVQVNVGDLVRLRVEETGRAPALVAPVVTLWRRRSV
jgi:hypothetical protein